MPTYVYGCDSCGHEFEKEQRITEGALQKCPQCGKNKLKRLITQGNFILKGGGWYADLYTGPSNQKSAASAPPSSEGTSTSTPPAASTSKDAGASTKPPGGEAKGRDAKGAGASKAKPKAKSA